MGLPEKVRRFVRHQTLPILLVNALSSVASVAVAADTVCIDTAEYRRLAQRYADLSSRFDLTTVAQDFVDISVDAQDLKENIDACRKNFPEPDEQHCDPLAKQYDAAVSQLKAIQIRFYDALYMQEYLLTLKLNLEQPECGK